MHKVFHATGFLYTPETEQILLQRSSDSPDSPWTLFIIETTEDTVDKTLISHINSLLKLKLLPEHSNSVYRYLHKDLNQERIISFIELPKYQEFPPHKGFAFNWFTRKQIVKAHLDSQIRQDITVGLRVIDARLRKSLGQHTLL